MAFVSASLLAADYARLGEEVIRAENAGADALHFDMMDGLYVPNLALAPQHLVALRPHTRLPFHVHLELGNPDQVLETFGEIPAQIIIVQWNTLPDPAYTLGLIRQRGVQAGLSLNPDEPLSDVEPYLSQLEYLILLSVQPGFGGQPMASGFPDRIAAARQLVDAKNPALPIAVDGGVNHKNAPALVAAGADWLIAGTALFQPGDQPDTMERIIQELKKSPMPG